jgi:WD40 repeat protein
MHSLAPFLRRFLILTAIGFLLLACSAGKKNATPSPQPILYKSPTAAHTSLATPTVSPIPSRTEETVTPLPTHTPTLPTATMTLSPSIQSTSTSSHFITPESSSKPSTTPMATFVDPRKSLPPGQYVVYWRVNTWYIQGLDGSPGIRLMPVESPYSEAKLSLDGNQIAFINIDKQISVYDLVSGKLTAYPNTTQNYITDIGWSPDGKMLIYTGLFDETPSITSRYGFYVVLLEAHWEFP